MNNGDTNINDKDTNSGLYMNYNSYEPWHCKVISQNSYRRYIRNKIIKRLENWKNTKNNNIHVNTKILPHIFAKYPLQDYKKKH